MLGRRDEEGEKVAISTRADMTVVAVAVCFRGCFLPLARGGGVMTEAARGLWGTVAGTSARV